MGRLKPLTYLLVDFENLQPPAKDVALVRGDEYRLWIFHGPHQNKFAADMVVAWQPLGKYAHFVQSSKPGKNALDFHIAFSLGELHGQNSTSNRPTRYLVVSKDGGFDSLFDHMRKLGCAVGKAKSIPEALLLAESLVPETTLVESTSGLMSLTSPSANTTSNDRIACNSTSHPVDVVAQARSSGNPKKLTKSAAPVLRRTMAQDDADKVIAELRAHPKNRPSDHQALERHTVSVLRNKVTMEVSNAVIEELERRKVVTSNGKKVEYKIPKAKKKTE